MNSVTIPKAEANHWTVLFLFWQGWQQLLVTSFNCGFQWSLVHRLTASKPERLGHRESKLHCETRLQHAGQKRWRKFGVEDCKLLVLSSIWIFSDMWNVRRDRCGTLLLSSTQTFIDLGTWNMRFSTLLAHVMYYACISDCFWPPLQSPGRSLTFQPSPVGSSFVMGTTAVYTCPRGEVDQYYLTVNNTARCYGNFGWYPTSYGGSCIPGVVNAKIHYVVGLDSLTTGQHPANQLLSPKWAQGISDACKLQGLHVWIWDRPFSFVCLLNFFWVCDEGFEFYESPKVCRKFVWLIHRPVWAFGYLQWHLWWALICNI